MTLFQSNEEFFQAVRDLIARLEHDGRHDAAARLREGFGALNGLTDGAAAFLEAIDEVQVTASRSFHPDVQHALEKIRKAVHSAVYRRS